MRLSSSWALDELLTMCTAITRTEESFAITNYHLSVATHERALQTAGFQRVTWHDPELSPEIVEGAERHYWSAFLDHPPVVFLDCVK
ncbi:MAG: hypothetical protein EXR78_00700 [Deltaproteobacteria bacterium]|nr:hypothetical protein [Deltaproteobacteria bacterium]